jgi:hypothetical protein
LFGKKLYNYSTKYKATKDSGNTEMPGMKNKNLFPFFDVVHSPHCLQ